MIALRAIPRKGTGENISLKIHSKFLCCLTLFLGGNLTRLFVKQGKGTWFMIQHIFLFNWILSQIFLSFRKNKRYYNRLKQKQQFSIPDIFTAISDESEYQPNNVFDPIFVQCFESVHDKSILDFETKMSKVKPSYCKVCFRCSLELNLNKVNVCQMCQKAKIDPINNNILPIWYSNEVPQMTVPEELSCLRLAEKCFCSLCLPLCLSSTSTTAPLASRAMYAAFPRTLMKLPLSCPGFQATSRWSSL